MFLVESGAIDLIATSGGCSVHSSTRRAGSIGPTVFEDDREAIGDEEISIAEPIATCDSLIPSFFGDRPSFFERVSNIFSGRRTAGQCFIDPVKNGCSLV